MYITGTNDDRRNEFVRMPHGARLIRHGYDWRALAQVCVPDRLHYCCAVRLESGETWFSLDGEDIKSAADFWEERRHSHAVQNLIGRQVRRHQEQQIAETYAGDRDRYMDDLSYLDELSEFMNTIPPFSEGEIAEEVERIKSAKGFWEGVDYLAMEMLRRHVNALEAQRIGDPNAIYQ